MLVLRLFTALLTMMLSQVSAAATALEPKPTRSPEPDRPAVQPAPFRSNTEFFPSKHGFAFKNAFTGSPLPEPLQDLGLEELVDAPAIHGKCGGMSAAAADYFFARKDRPGASRPPRPRSALYNYIAQRQIDSLGPFAVQAATFMEFMLLPDRLADIARGTQSTPFTGSRHSAASRTLTSVAPLISRLRQGELVPLGLVYVYAPGMVKPDVSKEGNVKKGEPGRTDEKNQAGRASGRAEGKQAAAANAGHAGMPWENHQVLAFAAEFVPAREDSPTKVEGERVNQGYDRIRIYDPNFPGRDDIELRITPPRRSALSSPALGAGGNPAPAEPPEVTCVQYVGATRTIHVRGFFIMPYQFSQPKITADR